MWLMSYAAVFKYEIFNDDFDNDLKITPSYL